MYVHISPLNSFILVQIPLADQILNSHDLHADCSLTFQEQNLSSDKDWKDKMHFLKTSFYMITYVQLILHDYNSLIC